MGELFLKVFNMSITGSVLIIVVSISRLFLKKVPKWITCLLWGMVAIRLICPFSLESSFSLMPSDTLIKTGAVAGEEAKPYIPSVDSDYTIIKNVVNPVLQESFAYPEYESAAPLQIFLFVCGLVWISGVGVMILCALISRIKITLMLKEAVLFEDSIYLCDAVNAPFVLGTISPKIFLPSGLTSDKMEYIAAHEKAHIKRKDHWWKPFGYILLAVYWFQPFCWLAYTLFCRDIELACDEKVIQKLSFDEKKIIRKCYYPVVSKKE